MEPPGEDLAALAAAAKLPAPDNPDDENSPTTLPSKKVRAVGLLLGTLLDYLKIQFERCGKEPA